MRMQLLLFTVAACGGGVQRTEPAELAPAVEVVRIPRGVPPDPEPPEDVVSVPPAPVPPCTDQFEPNNAWHTPSLINPSVVYRDLSICPYNDSDYFEFELLKPAKLEIVIEQSNLTAEVGNSLTIYVTSPQIHSMAVPVNRTGSYSTRGVRGLIDATPGPYSISIRSSSAFWMPPQYSLEIVVH